MTARRTLAIGAAAIPCFRSSGPPPAPGHRAYSGLTTPLRHSTDSQADLIPRVIHERRRRALYADCERSPLNWENQQ